MRTAELPAPYIGTAFGLQVRTPFAIAGLPELLAAHHLSDRSTELVLKEPKWPTEGTTRTCELHRPSGEVVLTIDRHAEVGYRVWVRNLGHLVVSPDGRSIAIAPPETRRTDPFRLVFSQGLPIAAALQGLEVLHASAVVLRGKAVAITAVSGTGKTSLALALLERGAELLADDVVALEVGRDGVVAHPGVALVHKPVGDRKVDVAMSLAARPAPLVAVCFLGRSSQQTGVEARVLEPGDPRPLLASTFVSHVPTAERLVSQLDICSRIARTAELIDLRGPLRGGPMALADRLDEMLP